MYVSDMGKGSNSTVSIAAADDTKLDRLKKKTAVAQVVVKVVVVVVGSQDADRGQVIIIGLFFFHDNKK
jgi:hypothetical protein